MRQSNCSNKSTSSNDGGGAETLVAAAMQQGDRELVDTVPIVNGRYIMCQKLVMSWKRIPSDGRRDGIAACDKVGSLVEM